MDIEIRARREKSGLIIAWSPDLPGLHVMERTMLELYVSLLILVPILQAERGQLPPLAEQWQP